MRRMRICFTADFSAFFVFSIRHKNTGQPFLGTAGRIFMKLLPNDSEENVVSNVVTLCCIDAGLLRVSQVESVQGLEGKRARQESPECQAGSRGKSLLPSPGNFLEIVNC